MTSLWNRARERFFQTDLKIWSDRAASGAGENIGSTAWNMEEDTQYEYASNCGVVWTPASTTPSEIAFIPTVTLGSVEDALFTRGAALAMDWDPEGTPLSASYNTKRVGVTGIQSVTWKERTAELSDDPHQSDESVRVYPEKDLDGTLKNKLKVQVELVKEVPDGMEGTVFLKILDPHNQCTGSSSNGMESVIPISDWLLDESDNFGYANFVLSSLLFEGHNIETLETDKIQNATFEINSAHAGDNYIVVVMPNSESCDAVSIQTVPDAEGICDYKTPGLGGGNGSVPVSENHKTSLLTVWRTLWLEVDCFDYLEPEVREVYLDGCVKEELERACISIEEYTNNAVSLIVPEVDEEGNIPDWICEPRLSDPSSDEYDYEEGIIPRQNEGTQFKNYIASYRSIPVSANELWAIQVTAAESSYLWESWAECWMGSNTIVLFMSILEQVANSRYSNPFQETSLEINKTDFLNCIKSRTLLHEIAHTFGILDGDGGLMMYLDDTSTHLICAPYYQQFTASHIRTIQSQARP